MKKCTRCDMRIDSHLSVCPRCTGTDFIDVADTKICTRCNMKVDSHLSVCPRCTGTDFIDDNCNQSFLLWATSIKPSCF